MEKQSVLVIEHEWRMRKLVRANLEVLGWVESWLPVEAVFRHSLAERGAASSGRVASQRIEVPASGAHQQSHIPKKEAYQ
jgi:hypothetical protein